MAAVVRLMSMPAWLCFYVLLMLIPAWLCFYVLLMLIPACNNDHSLF